MLMGILARAEGEGGVMTTFCGVDVGVRHTLLGFRSLWLMPRDDSRRSVRVS